MVREECGGIQVTVQGAGGGVGQGTRGMWWCRSGYEEKVVVQVIVRGAGGGEGHGTDSSGGVGHGTRGT